MGFNFRMNLLAGLLINGCDPFALFHTFVLLAFLAIVLVF
jgi:hypothetical protein